MDIKKHAKEQVREMIKAGYKNVAYTITGDDTYDLYFSPPAPLEFISFRAIKDQDGLWSKLIAEDPLDEYLRQNEDSSYN